MTTSIPNPEIIFTGWQPQAYLPALQSMRDFTEHRDATTPDQIWFLNHERVFTQGKNGKAEHLLAPGDIPVIQIDRGGQVTYHGPGQIVCYLMLDIKRLKFGIRGTVSAMENAIINTLASYNIPSHALRDAPGVYVGDDKIASLGLRIRKGRCYHGFALNVDMDLEPFSRINPCGYAGLKMTQIADHGGPSSQDLVREDLTQRLLSELHLPEPQIAHPKSA